MSRERRLGAGPVRRQALSIDVTELWARALVRPMNADEADRVVAWTYDGPWAVYNMASVGPIRANLDSYYSVTAGEQLIGFCCSGIEARIGGMAELPDVVDIGLGMDPALVGRGSGVEFGAIVLEFVGTLNPGCRFRAVVQSWNERSLRLIRSLGFEQVETLTAVQDGRPVEYRVFIK